MMATAITRVRMSDDLVNELASAAVEQWPSFLAEYDRFNKLGHIKNEDYAPAAELCSSVFYDHVRAGNVTNDYYERGTVGRILNAFTAKI